MTPCCQDWSPAHFAAREGHTQILRLVVTKGARVDAVTGGGWTPLMLVSNTSTPHHQPLTSSSHLQAAAFNKLDTARLLLSLGADTRRTNGDGASAEVSTTAVSVEGRG